MATGAHPRSPFKAQIAVFLPNPMKARIAWLCVPAEGQDTLFVPIHLHWQIIGSTRFLYRWVYTLNMNPQKFWICL